MSLSKILFIDRDGTLIEEPSDFQIDSFEKFKLVTGVIPALLKLRDAGFRMVMVSNQDHLGSPQYPQAKFDQIQGFLIDLCRSQGIEFDAILICPHGDEDGCECRKPKTGLLKEYLRSNDWDRPQSAVIGDRLTDVILAERLGTRGYRLDERTGWKEIMSELLRTQRSSQVTRKTHETQISARVDLDQTEPVRIDTGLGFFDHMLEQVAKHGGFSLELQCQGDLWVDEHHSIEDVGLVLGEVLAKALGEKRGISRFGFSLPMDEASAEVLLDLSGRPYSVFEGQLTREKVGDLPLEMIPHFFRSFAESLRANLHVRVKGENNHHQVEAAFKALGRALRQATRLSSGTGVPSTKGVL